MNDSFSLDKYMQRLGGWYIILIVVIAQLSSIFGALLGSFSIQSNGDFDPETMARISRYVPFLIIIANLILLAVAWYLTQNARKRLTDWTRNQLRANPREELAAWQEITAFTTRYGTSAVLIAYVVSVLPTAAYYFRAGVTTFDQFIYTLLGGLVSNVAAPSPGRSRSAGSRRWNRITSWPRPRSELMPFCTATGSS